MTPGSAFDPVMVAVTGLQSPTAADTRADGGYVMLLEDDYKSKIVIYRWKR